MNKFINTIFVISLIITLSSKLCIAQEDKIISFEAEISRGFILIDDKRQFEKALDLYLELDKVPISDLVEQPSNQEHLNRIKKAKKVVKAHIVDCYTNIDNQAVKAIPYFESLEDTEYHGLLRLPFKKAGEMFMDNYNFEKAILYFNKSQKSYKEKDRYGNLVRRKIEMCENAIHILSTDTISHVIQDIDEPITTNASEHSPYINREGSILYFTKDEIVSERSIKKVKRTFMFSIKNIYLWEAPQELKFSKSIQFDYSTTQMAGISPDGSSVYFNIVNNGNSDIYEGIILNGLCVKLNRIWGTVNTEYYEGKVSLSDDNKTLYFVSSRDGRNGRDIYKAEKLSNGRWGNVVNLGSKINTIYDEDYPFAIGNELYFSSEGHTSMGGYDIFKSKNSGRNWQTPENVGFPINTVQDNKDFSICSKYERGYFSSTRFDKNDTHDIFFADMGKNIELTCLKGVINGGYNQAPIRVKIVIIDLFSGKKIDYVYDPKTMPGNYLALLRPGRDYKIYVEDLTGKFASQLLMVRVPRQTDFYAIVQDINLQELIPLDKKIGDKIIIENAFYDALYDEDIEEKRSFYANLLALLEDLIEKSDHYGLAKLAEMKWEPKPKEKDYTELLNMVENAILTSDSVTLRMLDKVSEKSDIYERSFLYKKNDFSNFINFNLEGTEYFSAPLLQAYPLFKDDILRQRINKNLKGVVTVYPQYNAKPPKNKEVEKEKEYVFEIYFDKSSDKVKRKYKEKLEHLSEFLVNNYGCKIFVIGFNGEDEYSPNLIISEERVDEVVEILSANGINTEHIKREYKLGTFSDDKENQKVKIVVRDFEDLRIPPN